MLSAFRGRLVKGGAESLLFDRLLVLCREQGFLAQHGRQRAGSAPRLGADVNRRDDDADPSKPDEFQVLRWRTEAEGCPPSTPSGVSPHDLHVHHAKKRATTWIGTKVHLTETCEVGHPVPVEPCQACPLKALRTRPNRRVLASRRREEHETLVSARTAAKDPALTAERGRRAGIEGTLSRAVRVAAAPSAQTGPVSGRSSRRHRSTSAASPTGSQGTKPAQTRRSVVVRLMAAPA